MSFPDGPEQGTASRAVEHEMLGLNEYHVYSGFQFLGGPPFSPGFLLVFEVMDHSSCVGVATLEPKDHRPAQGQNAAKTQDGDKDRLHS